MSPPTYVLDHHRLLCYQSLHTEGHCSTSLGERVNALATTKVFCLLIEREFQKIRYESIDVEAL